MPTILALRDAAHLTELTGVNFPDMPVVLPATSHMQTTSGSRLKTQHPLKYPQVLPHLLTAWKTTAQDMMALMHLANYSRVFNGQA